LSFQKLHPLTSWAITGEGNTQHTPCYAAPEFLKNPTDEKTNSMDVYSFGMIGYEILTRQVVYEGAPFNLIVNLNIAKGQKPNLKCLQNVAELLEQNKNDLEIFSELNKIVQSCWQTTPDDRPEISEVQKRLDELAQTKLIYNKRTDGAVENIIEQRRLNSHLPLRIYPSTIKRLNILLNQSKKWFLLILAVVFTFPSFLLFSKQSYSNNNVSGSSFLVIDQTELFKYEIESRTVTYLGNVDTSYPNVIGDIWNECIVKVNEQAYIFRNFNHSILVSLNSSNLSWTKLDWDVKYTNRRYISSGSYLYAIGGLQRKNITTSNLDPKFLPTVAGDVDTAFLPTAAGDVYDTATKLWTELPDKNESRERHSLVVFQELICALGGDNDQRTCECFNPNTRKWSYLPEMDVFTGMHVGAVELNGELYVIGGEYIYYSGSGSPREYKVPIILVRKYNPFNNSWSDIASLNGGRSSITSMILNGKIYVVGGSHNPSIVEIYDPSKNTWEQDNLLNFSTFARYTVF